MRGIFTLQTCGFHSRSRQGGGFVLLIVLGFLALFSVLGLVMVQFTSMERSIGRQFVWQTRATMVAEAGLESAVSHLQDLEGGVIRPDELAWMQFGSGNANTFGNTDKPSFNLPAPNSDLSGIVGSSLAADSDVFKLKVEDDSAKLNLNDSNGLWNIDTDPWEDTDTLNEDRGGYGDDNSDINAAEPRLQMVLAYLLERLFGDPGNPSSTYGKDIAADLLDARDQLPGRQFKSWRQVKEILVDAENPDLPNPLTEVQYEELLQHVALWNWQDPNVIRPTFRLSISHPEDLQHPADLFNVYLYADFQTRRFEFEPRSPVNVNTTSVEVLESLIAGVQGWYLYEGTPCSLMDASLGSPWVKAMRASSNCFDDLERNCGYKGSALVMYHWASPSSPIDTLGDQTRWGEARLTEAITSDMAGQIAAQIYSRVHDKDDPRPFRTWDEFSRFITEMVDGGADISTAAVETDLEIMPSRIHEHCSYDGAASEISGFSRYQAAALLANFNPNAQLNDHNPDAHLFRHVDKAQLTRYTSELSFQPTGVFSIESLGMVRDEDGGVIAHAHLRTSMRVFYLLRHSTQQQFMSGYDVEDPESLYGLFAESDGRYPTAGADLVEGTGALRSGGHRGPSLCSYPEPLRLAGALSIAGHPDGERDYFSRYAGQLQLATWQPSASDYNGATPMFMAPMSTRSADADDFNDRAAAVGGMMPVLWGQNAATTSDDIDRLNANGGRGAMLTWGEDYSFSSEYPNPYWTPGAWDPQPIAEWNHVTPWEDYRGWRVVHNLYDDHAWETYNFFNSGFIGPDISFDFDTMTISEGEEVRRMTWNTPSDSPLTPDVEDGQTQGNLYPDGAFSEPGRLLAYPSTNLGSNHGTEGALCFWAKPNWDAGYSNRIRQLFSMGRTGHVYTHALDLLYFPVHDQAGVNERSINLNLGSSSDTYPVPTHSFMFGWYWNTSPEPVRSTRNMMSFDIQGVRVSETATDFFPARDHGKRGSHPSFGFYGHQWNFFGLNYRNNTASPNVLPPEEGEEYDPLAFDLVQYTINGEEVLGGGFSPGHLEDIDEVNSDFYWEENTFPHGFATPGSAIEEGRYTHIGTGYLRFGWCAENAGPTGDSTYDDIVTFANPVNVDMFNEKWRHGRYQNALLPDDSNRNDSAVGLFTSGSIDVVKALRDQLPASAPRISLHSVSWTGMLPRYNWRPDASADSDWRDWPARDGYDGFPGIDLHASASQTPEADPVTGDWDMITVDVLDGNGAWLFSGDEEDDDDTRLYANMDEMLSQAGGQGLHEPGVLSYSKGGEFKYRVYFHMDADKPLLESPALEDITFCFVSSRPQVLSYEILFNQAGNIGGKHSGGKGPSGSHFSME